MKKLDVAVVGGGPAGCAAALGLRAHAPGLSVALLEASGYGAERVGETLPPPAAAVLEHLGAWDAFRAQGHHEAYGTAAAWGHAVPHENEFLFHVRQVGWHLDRAAFDAMLADTAAARGVDVGRETRLVDFDREDGGWTLRLSTGDELRARFVVDATGAAAAFARRRGARPLVLDRLAGFARFFRERGASDPRTLVEAFADGWWYTAPLPGGRRVAVCMTDSDIGRELRLNEVDAWSRLLATTAPQTRSALRDAEPCGAVTVRAARSRRLDPVVGDGWIAVGDAASTFDPLSSQGILKALRSGVFAAYAVGDLLAKGDDAGMARYRRFIEGEFAGYRTTRAKYYAEERRWPGREFWRRRIEKVSPQAVV